MVVVVGVVLVVVVVVVVVIVIAVVVATATILTSVILLLFFAHFVLSGVKKSRMNPVAYLWVRRKMFSVVCVCVLSCQGIRNPFVTLVCLHFNQSTTRHLGLSSE